MAASSSSTSSIQKRFKYEVFLSFRGADTRNNFVGHLYNALQQKSIETYKDDEKIKKGENISNELITSIENSKFYIIVFSKNYASSPWCLNELVKIMECQRTADHTAYPLFYDVEPSEVRKQSGAVKEAFVKNEKKEAAGKWREALREAADLAGWELKNTANGDEAKLIKKIVEELSLALRCIRFNIDEDLVGMESRMKEVLSSFGTDSNDVRMIGIKGMGGGGKTTLARAVYDHISYEFEGKSFVENVREVSKASLSGLKSLQCQLLSDVFNDESIRVSSVSDGKHMMKRRMCDKKVLVVLDDVDHIDQLQALAGEPNWFKIGSRIIITTRDEQVLVAHGVKFRVKFSHDVNLLSDKEATFLFCRYAFGKDIPTQGYEELSKQVVRYADGLPLTIKVLGSDLCGQNVFHWKDVLKRLEKIPLQETQKKLEISYMGLEEDHKEIFLDVACLFNRRVIDFVIKALESCGFHSRSGLRVLEQKSLITLYNGYVGMHDHIAEMGRNIVRRSHPPHEHSRLWDRGEIEDIFTNDLGTEATRCIQLYTKNFSPCMVVNGLRKMKRLRFLSIQLGTQNLEIDIAGSDFPNALQYLEWTYYPFRSLPTTFQAKNLVTLEMTNSSIIQLWEGKDAKVLSNLKNLDLSYSRLMSTLDLRLLAPNLEMLELLDCTNLVELHMPVDCLNLTTIKISRSLLRTLDLGQTPNIEVLDLTECNYLEELHMNGECQNLYILKITCSKLRSLDIGLTPNLEQLTLTNSYELEDLQMSDGCQKLIDIDIRRSKLRTFDLGKIPNVKMLDLTRCKYLEELQIPNGCPKSLVNLEISGSLRFISFKFYIVGNTYCSENASESHEALEIGPLAELQLIAESLESCRQHPGNNLPKFHFNCLYKEDRPSSTRNLEILLSLGMCACTDLETFSRSICGLQRLRKLKLEGSILEAPLDLGQLKCLEELILSSTKINHLPDSICMLKNLQSLKLESCLLEKLPDDLGRLDCLEKLTLLSSTIEHLPDSICMLKRLRSLKLRFCWLLEKFPDDVGELKCLKKLELSSAKIKRLPDSICMLKNLKSLKLSTCLLLEELPEDIGRLECLEELILSSTVIKHLPDSICMLKRLQSLQLTFCWLLEKLPEYVGGLKCLEKLTLSSAKIKHLPDSICMLKHLKSLKLNPCILLEELPEDLGRLERLEELHLSSTVIKHLPDSICMLKQMIYLELHKCSLLEKLPGDLGRLERLEELILRQCETLEGIPNSICEMKCLNRIHLQHCIRVEKLPEELGCLERLKSLDIQGTSISHLPQSILLSKGLMIYGSRGILESCGFTYRIHTFKTRCYVVV